MTALSPATSVPSSAKDPSRRQASPDPWWLLVDPLLILSALATAAMGALLVYSATRGVVGDFTEPDTSYLERQVLYIAVGLVGAVAVAFAPLEWMRKLYPAVFALMLASLVVVALFGVEVNGTRAWLELGPFRLQPSEPAKLGLIFGLAMMLSPGKRAPGTSPAPPEVSLTRTVLALALALAPIALILLQPDVGTMLVYLVITLLMVVISGVRARWIVLLVIVAVVGAVGIYRSDVLAEYQEARLRVYLFTSDVSEESTSYAFNVEQAQIAIGNGGLRGQGLFQGTQTRSDLVPQQQTDFIFTVAGEELGLRGASVLLGLLSLLLFRVWRTAQLAATSFEQLMSTGIFAMLLFQTFQSVGMTMGMMPVTGIPLPLVSYGGSSMLTTLVALGLVAGVYRRRLGIEGMIRAH
ncbi:MAG: FtsW/RodA/SpoVE family cell cycle protein [Acidimicrobiaceae bacterium]|nr:FtsW/RodA/SpoVE family cell cycle protein [Acidimicrobiaceae bacterium]MCY4175290.1 FtsW/RodA/SpoVE family cell cycle protein [Acidimicrobiaceae bacterium]MCY4279675.1 FtsW/RodA/SpoVE family cell cycle protein [Acidimicrobiaceae bacterium]MCY4293375.1 FtsW/RodA/SpoVE family cell cycle protein [Acidimicrobiaceae bacterium]